MSRGRSTEPAQPLALAGRFAIVFLLLTLAAVAYAEAPGPDLRFDQADFVASDAVTPPETGWQPQSLPDSWLHSRPGFRGIGWYRMRFQLASQPPQTMALYVARVSVIGQFWLNGSVLNPEIRFTDPEARVGSNVPRSQLIPIPVGLFRIGENVVHVRVQSFGLGGDGLWEVCIAPIDRVRGSWLIRDIPQWIVPQALFALMVAGCVFALLVWWRERRARNLHFAGVTVLWTVLLGLYVLPSPPLTQRELTSFISVVVTLFYWGLLGLFYRYSESEWHWYPRVLNVVSGLTLCAVLGLTLFEFAGNTQHFSERMGAAMLPTAFLRILATVMLLQSAWRKPSLRSYALAAAELLWFAGHVQTIGTLIGWWSPEPFRIDPTCSLPLYFVLLFLFVERLVQGREQAILEKQTAVDRERTRLLHDVHDGMGSHLITALRLARSDNVDRAVVADTIEEALQDLRLIIDSLDIGNQGLVQVLGNLRYRLEPRLGALGIRLEWDVQPLDELETITPEVALGVLRIVQEALNNAVKHAHSRVITISITRREGRPVISVADDGVGFDPDDPGRPGRGLHGMRRRAAQLGATFHISRRDGGGTRASLHLPSLPA